MAADLDSHQYTAPVSPLSSRNSRHARVDESHFPDAHLPDVPLSNSHIPLRDLNSDHGNPNNAGLQNATLPRQPVPTIERQRGNRAPAIQQRGRSTAGWLLLLTLLFVALAIMSWTILAIQSRHPISISSYGWDNFSGLLYFKSRSSYYDTNDNLYTAVRIILGILGLLAVPLVLCLGSSAATVYVERRKLSMQQAVKIASHSLGLWSYLIIFISVLGFITFLLPLILVTPTQMYTPNYANQMFEVLDFPSTYVPGIGSNEDITNYTILSTRQGITITSNIEPQAMLWTPQSPCNQLDAPGVYALPCQLPGSILGNLSLLADPFIAQLAFGTNTGTTQQFIPRINSTATYENVTEFPECSGPNTYYKRYTNSSIAYSSIPVNFTLEVCVSNTTTGLVTKRERQDITEELYIRLSTYAGLSTYEPRPPLNGIDSYIGRVTLKTTTGYFELPNYHNGNQPGPIIENATIFNNLLTENYPTDSSSWSGFDDGTTNAPLMTGPLLTVAHALFGAGSFIDNAVSTPQRYTAPGSSNDGQSFCIEYLPLNWFLGRQDGQDFMAEELPVCIDSVASEDLALQTITWLNNFAVFDHERLSNAFSASAFVANREWIKMQLYFSHQFGNSILIDVGELHWKPEMSLAGLIVISIFMAVFLLMLLSLAIYGNLRKGVYNHLHPFFMVYFGAANARNIGGGSKDAAWHAMGYVPAWVRESKPLIDDDGDLVYDG